MQKPSAIELAKTIGRWIPTLLLASIFIPQGFGKFSATSGWRRAFEHWGYPMWFLLTIGAIELIAGLLLLWRRSAPIAAIMIITVMAGAMWTHAWVDGRPREVFHEVVPMALALIVLAIRWRELSWITSRSSRAG